MADNLSIINRVIQEHQNISGHIRLVGDSISDEEALASLTKARPDWIPGRMEILSEKQNKLQQALNFLGEGLRNHFTFEEEVLPLLLGELFVRALTLDHREIEKGIDEAKSMVPASKLEGLSREELVSRESKIHQVIDSLCQMVEEHASREEIILEMVQRVLEEEKKSRG